MKLGEMLINAGRITQAQLEETLKGQAIFGGRFGTNLVEMGYLDEHDLAHFLSKQTGVPHASPEQLMDVPAQVIRLIPEEAVRKYRVIPVAINNRKLTLAMTDPSDFATIDEISFVTGYIVVPVITPELRLVSALEKHYNIRREMRYISVEGGTRRGRLSQPAAAQAPNQMAPNTPAPSSLVQSSPAQSTLAVNIAPSHLAVNLAPPRPEPEDDDILELPLLAEYELFGDFGKSAQEPVQPVQTAPLATETKLAEPEKDYSLDAILLGLTQAHDRHGIGELIVNYTAQQFDRAALFLLKGGKATGWVAQSGKKPVSEFDTLEIPLSEPSVLSIVADSKNYYLGPMPLTPGNTKMLSALGAGTPINNLLVPLLMMGRVVAILYVEGGTVRLDERVADLQRLLSKGSMAFEILILKSKILLT
jgi:hypothetical protein